MHCLVKPYLLLQKSVCISFAIYSTFSSTKLLMISSWQKPDKKNQSLSFYCPNNYLPFIIRNHTTAYLFWSIQTPRSLFSEYLAQLRSEDSFQTWRISRLVSSCHNRILWLISYDHWFTIFYFRKLLRASSWIQLPAWVIRDYIW